MNLTVSYKDLRRRVQELESQLLSTDPELIISPDELQRIQRDTLHYFDRNGQSTFAGYELVRELNFYPLQPAGADAKKKLFERLCRNLRTLSNELDRAEALIRMDDPAVSSQLEQPDPGVADSGAASPRQRRQSQRRLIREAVVRVKDELDQLLSCRYTDYASMRTDNPRMSVFQIIDKDPERPVSLGKIQTTLKQALLDLPRHARRRLGLAKVFVAKEFDVTPDAVNRHWKKTHLRPRRRSLD